MAIMARNLAMTARKASCLANDTALSARHLANRGRDEFVEKSDDSDREDLVQSLIDSQAQEVGSDEDEE